MMRERFPVRSRTTLLISNIHNLNRFSYLFHKVKLPIFDTPHYLIAGKRIAKGLIQIFGRSRVKKLPGFLPFLRISGVDGLDLKQMFACLLNKDMDEFFKLYQKIVISSTSYMDAKENAYHMLFLEMCIALQGRYQVTSNMEAGYGRSDITLKSLNTEYPSMIFEFKQGKDLEQLKTEALQQIMDQQYYSGLSGEVICVGVAHDKKRCEMIHKIIKL